MIVAALLAGACGGDADPATLLTGTPAKVGDVPGSERVPLHIWVANGNFRPPRRVDIHMWIEDTYVLGGDFDADGGTSNKPPFDLQVPSGELKLHALALDGQVVLDKTILVPAESWGFLTFWPANDDDPPRFTWDLFDHEVGPV